jgi:hypothetical protein
VETNKSDFRIYPTDICLSPPHGTTLTAIQMFADVQFWVAKFYIKARFESQNIYIKPLLKPKNHFLKLHIWVKKKKKLLL